MSEEKIASLPKPLTDLPKPDLDLPLPEKELAAHASESASSSTDSNNDESKSSYILKSFLLGILFVFLVILIGGGAFLLGRNTKSENQQVVETKVAAPSPTSIENKNVFSNEDFSFIYPDGYSSQNSINDDYFWKSEFTPNEFTYNSMVIQVQEKAFPALAKNSSFTRYPLGPETNTPITSTVSSVENFKDTTLNGNNVTTYNISCGVDCYYHVLEFNSNSKYYRLFFNGAGGGLITKFENMLTTFKFTDPNSGFTNEEIRSDAEKELGSNYTNVKIKKVFNDTYALGNAGFVEYGGVEFLVHLENGSWKVIWKGNEAPGCSQFTDYPDLPEDLCVNY